MSNALKSRIRKTVKPKSPPPMDVSDQSWATQPVRRMLPKIPVNTSSISPSISRKGTGLEEGRYGGLGGSRQKSLLQSVIRNLVDSSDEQERETQRSKLENDLEIADERLQELVREHREKLHGTVSTFQAVDEKMKESQAKIRKVKASLSSCKTLLRCKRDELQRLWLEDVKYKNMLQMIDSIAEVKAVPDLLKKYKSKKYYLHATELLNNSVARLERDLANVEALKDLKVELRLQKECLHEELIDELHRHLYVKATACKSQPAPVPQPGEPQSSSPDPPKKGGTLSRVTRISQRNVSSQETYRDDDQVDEEMRADKDPEENSAHFMAILVESLSILGRVKDSLDAIHTRMEKELLLIIERASVKVVRAAEQEAVGLLGQGKKRATINSPKLLTKMLKICFKKFQDVVSAHSVLLVHLQRAKRVYTKNVFKMYEEKDVWAAIQHVLQSVLQVYLAFSDDGSPMDTLYGGLAVSGPDFFTSYVRAKKHPAKASKKQFFRFDSSRHAISVSSYMREQRDIELVEGGSRTEGITKYADDQPSISQHLVCKPANRNVTVLFGPVREFILVVEQALDLPDGKHCLLYHFLHDYVEDHYLPRVQFESFTKMGNSVKSETAKTIAPDLKAIKVTSKQYVLNSVLVLWGLVEDLRQLMKDLPMYSTNFLSILCELLVGYRDSLQMFYRDLTSVMVEASKGSGGGPEAIVSSRWARDDDINRMIRSLPNWIRLYQGSKVSRHADDLEKMQSVYAKESMTLTNNLGSDLLRQSHVMLNPENLRLLAVFHESLDWFNSQLKQVVLDLTNLSEACGNAAPSIDSEALEGTSISIMNMAHGLGTEDSLDQMDLVEQISQFSSIQFEFQSLSETAIITLHLEVRCHCFFYLSSVQKSNYTLTNDAVREDANVRKLSADLRDIDQVMVAILSPDKYRYLFEGLGHLVATIFIASAQNMKSINNNGIKKMCGNISLLQSCLSKITLIREKDLDRARRYFELLYLNNEEILHQLMEQGPKFSHKEYSSALSLLANSHTKYPEDKLRKDLKELENLFSKDAV